MNENTPSEILAQFQAKYDWLKQQVQTLEGAIEPGVYKIPDGGWQCNYNGAWGYGCAITLRPGDAELHEAHGEICKRWYREGGAYDETGERGWLGYPISDEEVYDGDGDPADRISHFENGDIVWSEKTKETRIINIKDRSTWYENRRNELLGLLNDATALDIPGKYAYELRQTANKCQEDAFEIALIGEFQGGKSTTFNALCDGRDISPRGLGGGGIKTSAAVVTAQNISNGETNGSLAEWAEVSFKSAADIVMGMSTLLRPVLQARQDEVRIDLAPHLSEEEFSEKLDIDELFSSLLDFDKPKHRKILQSAVDSLWDKWNAKHDSLDDDEQDELRIATLQLRFYESPEYRSMVEKSVLDISEFQKLIAFPEDWESRWKSGSTASFSLEEAAFVFIRSVLVRLHSENLRRLGCRITDCPGLFANAYDTSVAFQTIDNADATWYLINGSKQIGDKDKKIIRAIAQRGMLGRIAATCNLKGCHEHEMTKIMPATKAWLDNALDNTGTQIDVFPYNARLAFLAMQGALLLDPARKESFTPTDEANMRKDANDESGTASPASMWRDMVYESGVFTRLNSLKTVKDLDAASVALVRRESLLDGILSRLETEIIPKKAKSILVDRGSDRAVKALVAYEEVLNASVNAAVAEETKWKNEVDKASEQLADFVSRAGKILQKSTIVRERDDLACRLARSFVSEALGEQFCESVSANICTEINKIKKEFFLTRKSFMRELRSRVMPLIEIDFNSSFARCGAKWNSKTPVGDAKILRNRVADVCDDIHDLWKDRDMDKQPIFKGIKPPSVEDVMVENACDGLARNLLNSKVVSSIAEQCRYGIFDCISAPFILFWDAIEALIDIFRSEEEKQRRLAEEIDKNKTKVRPAIKTETSKSEFREKLEEPLSRHFKKMLEVVEESIHRELENLKTDFENERIAQPAKMFGKSVEERLRIAAENKAICAEKIEPLRKRIEAFETNVKAELAG